MIDRRGPPQGGPSFFTTTTVRFEEEKLLRFSDAIAKRPASKLSYGAILKGLENKTFTEEQKKAYEYFRTERFERFDGQF